MSIEKLRRDINKLADAINRLRLGGVDLTPIYNQLAQKINISDFNNFLFYDFEPFKFNTLASLFDIILYHDIITGKPIVFIPGDRISGEIIIYEARNDDDALAYIKSKSDSWSMFSIPHIIYIKDYVDLTDNYDFSGNLALFIFPVPDHINTASHISLWLKEFKVDILTFTGNVRSERVVLTRHGIITTRFSLSQKYSGINHLVPAGSTYIDIVFPEPYWGVPYGVCVIPQWNTTVWVTNKTNTGFRVNFGTPPTTDSYIDWFIYENYPI